MQIGQFLDFMTSIILGSLSAETSLIISAPSSNAASATSAHLVSMEIPMLGYFFLIARTTGMIRAISSSESIVFAPGLVDSPPISNQSAPLSTISAAISRVSSTLDSLELA